MRSDEWAGEQARQQRGQENGTLATQEAVVLQQRSRLHLVPGTLGLTAEIKGEKAFVKMVNKN